MSARHTVLVVPALAALLVLGACGGDDSADTTSTSAAPSTVPDTDAPTTSKAPATTVAPTTPADGSADLPVPSTPADGSTDLPVPPPLDTTDSPLLISVTVGTDDDPERIESVPAGSVVTLSILNPNAADEFHLHDYDLGDDQVIPAGQVATFTFVADRTGDFELESHETDDVLLVLRVV